MSEVTNEDIMKKLDKLDDYFKQIVDNQKTLSKDIDDVFTAIGSAANNVIRCIG